MIEEKILSILAEVNNDIVKNKDKDLLALGIIDSFDIVNLVVEFEEAFGIEIDPGLVIPDNFRTIGAMSELIKSIVEGKE